MTASEPLIFNPTHASAEELEQTFVGRWKDLDNLQTALARDAKAKADRHWVLIGPRGSGKSHFTELLRRRLERDCGWSVARMPEEQYQVATLADLLEQIVVRLEQLSDSPFQGKDAASVEELAIDRIRLFRKTTRKPILVILENLGLLLGRKLATRRAQSRLREILSRNAPFILLCTATGYVDATVREEAPFYDFFHPLTLDDLSQEEVAELVVARARWDKDETLLANPELVRARLNALFHFSGGNPRLVLDLYSILRRGVTEELFSQLMKLLDEVTPYYQARLRDITPQMERILTEMALADRRLTPSEVARKTRMPTNHVTANIAKLEEERLVRAAGRPDRRRRYYEVTDRLFRLWIQMREEDAGKKTRLRAITTFFQRWYEGHPTEAWETAQRIAGSFWQELPKDDVRSCRDRLRTLSYLDDAVDDGQSLMVRVLERSQPPQSRASARESIEHIRSSLASASDAKERAALACILAKRLTTIDMHEEAIRVLESVRDVAISELGEHVWKNYIDVVYEWKGIKEAYKCGIKILREHNKLVFLKGDVAELAVRVGEPEIAVSLVLDFINQVSCEHCRSGAATGILIDLVNNDEGVLAEKLLNSLPTAALDESNKRAFEFLISKGATPGNWLAASNQWSTLAEVPPRVVFELSCQFGHAKGREHEAYPFIVELFTRGIYLNDHTRTHLVVAFIVTLKKSPSQASGMSEWITQHVDHKDLKRTFEENISGMARALSKRHLDVLAAYEILRKSGAIEDDITPYAAALEIRANADPEKAKLALHPEIREAVELLIGANKNAI